MILERQKLIEEIFIAAIERAPQERDAVLQSRCRNDANLLKEVRSLIAHHDRDAGVLDQQVMPAGGSWLKDVVVDAAELPPNPHVGNYSLLSVLGSGGMGVVYRAEQHRTHRTVAVKVIHQGAGSAELKRRFEAEAAMLARLQHPGIAQIFEAGVADFGHGPQPFIAMELVEGVNLTTYVRSNELSVRAKLELMVQICDAIQHAHQRGVIHRDLKPANILVTRGATSASAAESAPRSAVKVLDFGVARLVDADMQLPTMHTSAGQLIGTLPYMSPEQVLADPSAMDTRTDVYALGVILYEMLAGRLPYDLHHRPVPEAARIITDQAPHSLSTFGKTFRGDLDTIAGKALEKEPARRYQSAAELALDIQRFLNDEPIIARPATTFYQLRKFVKRNKAVVGGVCGAFAALVLGVIGTTYGWLEAQRQRDDAVEARQEADIAALREMNQRLAAERQARIAQEINAFLNDDLLAQASPSNEANRDITLREVVDAAAARVGGRFDDEPLVEASLRTTIGDIYKDLGAFEQARPHLERALEIHLAEDAAVGQRQRDTLVCMNRLAALARLEGDLAAAERWGLQVQQEAGEALGSSDNVALTAVNALALIYMAQSRYADAEPLMRRVLDARSQTLGEEHKDTCAAMNNLAMIFHQQAKYEAAEPLHVMDLQVSRRKLGDDHPETIVSMCNLAVLYADMNKLDEAEALYLEAMERQQRVLGEQHPETMATIGNYAALLTRQRRFEEAYPHFLRCYELLREKFGDDNHQVIHALNGLGASLYLLKRNEEAEPLFAKALECARRTLGEEHVETCGAMASLARIYRIQKRYAEGAPLAEACYRAMHKEFGADHPFTKKALEIIVGTYEDWGKPEIAAQWRSGAAPVAQRPEQLKE